MPHWIDLGPADAFPDGERRCLQPAGHNLGSEVVVLNLSGRLTAFANTCPHAGMPLAEGELSGCVITCPFHGYSFDVFTGKNTDFPDDVPLIRYPVRVQNGRVEVDVESAP